MQRLRNFASIAIKVMSFVGFPLAVIVISPNVAMAVRHSEHVMRLTRLVRRERPRAVRLIRMRRTAIIRKLRGLLRVRPRSLSLLLCVGSTLRRVRPMHRLHFTFKLRALFISRQLFIL